MFKEALLTAYSGSDLCRVQHIEGRRDSTRSKPGGRMGSAQHPRQHHLTRIHRDANGRGTVCEVSRPEGDVADTEHVGTSFSSQGIPWCSSVLGQRRQLVHDWVRLEDRRRSLRMVDSLNKAKEMYTTSDMKMQQSFKCMVKERWERVRANEGRGKSELLLSQLLRLKGSNCPPRQTPCERAGCAFQPTCPTGSCGAGAQALASQHRSCCSRLPSHRHNSAIDSTR